MKKIIMSIGLLFCVGCGSRIHVNVDSISSGRLLSDSECIILPADPNAIANQLQHQEYSGYIKRALEKKGYQVMDKTEEAEVVVFLKYGISEPHERITGHEGYLGTEITYTRLIELSAYDLEEYRKANEQVQLWKTTAISTGASGDFRLIFPVMVAALAEYIGEDTGKQIKVVLWENDKRVQEIKGLLEKQKLY